MMPRRTALAVSSDAKAIVLGAYTLTATGIEITGTPTWAEHEVVGVFIGRAVQASEFWAADWMRYGESRAEWASRLSQVADALGVSDKRAANIRAVGAIPLSRRRDGVEFAIHEEVAGLSDAQQDHWLARVAEGRWTRAELRHAIKAEKRRMIAHGRADTMHSVEVMVLVEVEAQDAYRAEEQARATVTKSVSDIPNAKVILAHARPR